MDIIATIGTVAEVSGNIKEIGEGIEIVTKGVDATLAELRSESGGEFMDNLEQVGLELVDLAGAMVRSIFSLAKVVLGVSERLQKDDETGASDVRSAGIGR